MASYDMVRQDESSAIAKFSVYDALFWHTSRIHAGIDRPAGQFFGRLWLLPKWPPNVLPEALHRQTRIPEEVKL
jgi:hypothetical protein